ncbi:MAG: TonB family protein [Myxococcota bacterium]
MRFLLLPLLFGLAQASDPPVQGDTPAEEVSPSLEEYTSTCKESILPNWTPLPAMLKAHPGHVTTVKAPVGADGTLGAARITHSSGDASFDRSVVMAFAKTRQVPSPPPHLERVAADGIEIRFAAKDK